MAWKSWAVGCAITAASMAAQPLTLGKERGAAWIGQPLELMVAVQLDPGENEICAQADVFHADSRQDPARVRVTLEPGNQGDSRILRINSATLVDEPVVSVYLSVGCSQKFTRKYVLLADFPNSPSVPLAMPALPTPLVPAAALAPPTALAPLPQSPPMPTADGAVAQAPTAPPTTAVAPAVATAPAAPPAAASATPARRKKAVPAPASAASTAASTAGKPRLQLDPMDALSDRAGPQDDGKSAPGTADAERIARLQKDVRALLEQAAKNEASLMALQAQLLQSQARSEPSPQVLLYALIALTLGSFAGMGWMWVRRTPSR